jgi:hypothetical protein
VVLEHDPLELAQAHESGELAVLDEFRGEGIRDAHEVPVAATIAVLDEGLDLVRTQSAEGRGAAPELLDELDISDAVLVLAGSEKGLRYEAQTVAFFRQDSYIVHDANENSPLLQCPQDLPIDPERRHPGVLTKNRLS